MKRIVLLFVILILGLTACSQLPKEIINSLDTNTQKAKDNTEEESEFDGVIQNEASNNTSDTLTSTFLNLNSVMGREYKSGIINDDTLQIILLLDGKPSEDFELFYSNDQETAMSLCEAFDIDAVNLKVVDSKEKLIFEITFSGKDKSYTVSSDYMDEIKENSTSTVKEYNTEYLKHEIVPDIDGNSVMMAYFNFTNNSSEPKELLDLFSFTAYQDGVQCDTYAMIENASEEFENRGKQIKDGANIDICFSVVLHSETSDVEIEVTEYSNEETHKINLSIK